MPSKTLLSPEENAIFASTDPEVIQDTCHFFGNLFESYLHFYADSCEKLDSREAQEAKAIACQRLAYLGFITGAFFGGGAMELGGSPGCRTARESVSEVIDETFKEFIKQIGSSALKKTN